MRLAAVLAGAGAVVGYDLSRFTKARNQIDTFYRASELMTLPAC